MSAEALHCPACGAPASSEAAHCEYCGTPLATVACPACLGRIFVGAKYCSHCGASAARVAAGEAKDYLCPRCNTAMNAIVLGDIHLLECSQCEGLWTDVETLQQICTEREKQAAVLGMPSAPGEPPVPEKNIRYVPCPVCRKLMNRVNFAHCSGVIVDVCKAHGTWSDKDELRRVVEFIRSGGLEKARAQQIAEMENERKRLEAVRKAGLTLDLALSSSSHPDRQGDLGDFLRLLLG